MLKIFLSYSRKDEDLKAQLDIHLSALKRNKLIHTWSDRAILPGDTWSIEIKTQLAQADIILLLVSADFIASDFIWKHELSTALERHERGDAIVIPICLRPCDWKGMPFAKLQGLPKDMIPVTKHSDMDEAFTDIARGLRKIVDRLNTK